MLKNENTYVHISENFLIPTDTTLEATPHFFLNFLVPKINGQLCNIFFFSSVEFKSGINYQATSKVFDARLNLKKDVNCHFCIKDSIQYIKLVKSPLL